jgi:hypothetical protein
LRLFDRAGNLEGSNLWRVVAEIHWERGRLVRTNALRSNASADVVLLMFRLPKQPLRTSRPRSDKNLPVLLLRTNGLELIFFASRRCKDSK